MSFNNCIIPLMVCTYFYFELSCTDRFFFFFCGGGGGGLGVFMFLSRIFHLYQANHSSVPGEQPPDLP